MKFILSAMSVLGASALVQKSLTTDPDRLTTINDNFEICTGAGQDTCTKLEMSELNNAKELGTNQQAVRARVQGPNFKLKICLTKSQGIQHQCVTAGSCNRTDLFSTVSIN